MIHDETLCAPYREICKKQSPLKALQDNGTVVGYVRISEPVKHHDATFECAAWWIDSVSSTGVFPVYVGQNYHSPHEFYFFAELPATVVEDSFQALWCGVGIGKGYDTKQNAGKPARNITVKKNLKEGVCQSTHSDDGGNKWAILPEFWDLVEQHARLELDKAIVYYPIALNSFQKEGYGHLDSCLTQLGYAGEKIHKCEEVLTEVRRKTGRGNGEPLTRSNVCYFEQNNTFLPPAETAPQAG